MVPLHDPTGRRYVAVRDGAETTVRRGMSRRPLYALLAGNAISQVGNSMTILAGPWFVLQTTGSAAKTGIVAAALAMGAVIPRSWADRSSIGLGSDGRATRPISAAPL